MSTTGIAASAMPVPSTTVTKVGRLTGDRTWLGPTTTTGCDAPPRASSLLRSRRIGPDDAHVVAIEDVQRAVSSADVIRDGPGRRHRHDLDRDTRGPAQIGGHIHRSAGILLRVHDEDDRAEPRRRHRARRPVAMSGIGPAGVSTNVWTVAGAYVLVMPPALRWPGPASSAKGPDPPVPPESRGFPTRRGQLARARGPRGRWRCAQLPRQIRGTRDAHTQRRDRLPPMPTASS